ncbi:MAG: LamG-like jellyroll fold domain-containing protein [Pseudomonadota bacterium]
MDYTHLVDLDNINTPAGMTPSIAATALSRVPLTGTGLQGRAYLPDDGRIKNTDEIADIVANQTADATFTATALHYASRDSETTLSEFLDEDGASVSGTDIEMGPSALVMTGYIYISPGPHTISVSSDDGFSLKIGGVTFSEFSTNRGVDETSRTAEFDGGLYPVEIEYYDQGGGMALSLEIDGVAVDDSALWQSVGDFQQALADGDPSVPAEEYHPSLTLGEAVIDDPETITGTDGADDLHGEGGDDMIDGGAGDDNITGGYGDDWLKGGAGDDTLEGGRGSDFLQGGDGNDIIIGRSDAGEQKAGQLVLDALTRPIGPYVDPETMQLKGWEYMPLVADDFYEGGAGADTFVITAQINARLEIIEKHTRSDGSINWAGVAGENTYVHDHWTDSFGIDTILDYEAGVDQIAIIGHTAEICDIRYIDTDGDGDLETIITVHSNQSGPCVATGNSTCHCANDNAQRAGGAHDQDLIGQLIVHGDLVREEDIITDAGVTFGIVDNISEVAEAIRPYGQSKITTVVNGDTGEVSEILGYDTRTPDGGWGEINGDPWNHVDNPYAAEAAAVERDPVEEEEIVPTRDPFEPLGTTGSTATLTLNGDGDSETFAPDEPDAPEGLPGALGYWSFGDEDEGAFGNLTGGGGVIKAYTNDENAGMLRIGDVTDGPNGEPGGALTFNGKDQFAYLAHDPAFQVTQGTIALWVRSDDNSDTGAIVTKDQRNSGEGGHFRLVQTPDGKLLLRMAPGDGGGNTAWQTTTSVLTEGEWTHLAVSFTETGVTVYRNGVALDDSIWTPVEGEVPSPGVFTEAYILRNQEPWVFGADQRRTEYNDSAGAFAADDDKLESPFTGAIAGFGIWGGFTPEDALDAAEITQLMTEGPGAALTNPSGPQPMDDTAMVVNAGGGNDDIQGGAGDDELHGEAGNDTILGGYGDDILKGGAGNDLLDGERGSDLLIGGDGDDTLRSRSDAGEQRIGQLVLDQNTRNLDQFEDPSVSVEYLKLVDWIDQPLKADDVLVGGAGADHFLFEALLNGKADILVDNTMGNGRMIHWHGVAGENKYLHDHWVDLLGIEIVADFSKAEGDTISVLGHTTQVEVSYVAYDSDGDGVKDAVYSNILAYSQQGKGGGAHDEDLIGHIAVFGDLVEEGDITTDAGVHYGIVRTLDELQEAVAPTGETKTSTYVNEAGETVELFGYDSRDVDGDPIGSNPFAFSDNPFLDQVDLDTNSFAGGPGNVVLAYAGGSFSGSNSVEQPHTPAQLLAAGSLVMTITPDSPGNGHQALFSKDHSNFETGGHLTIWIAEDGKLKVRMQDTDESTYLQTRAKLEAGETYQIAFTFDDDTLRLYVDGTLVDTEDALSGGMTGNFEDPVIGASTRLRRGDDDKLQWFYDGEITDLAMVDRVLTAGEIVLMQELGGDVTALAGIAPLGGASTPPPEPAPEPEPDPEPDPEPAPIPPVAEDPTPPAPTPPSGGDDEGGHFSKYLAIALYDTESDTLIGEITPGGSFSASELAGRSLAVVAVAAPDAPDFESVRFEHDGQRQTESIAPYAQFGDRNGDLRDGTSFDIGSHDMTLTVYSGDFGRGEVLEVIDLSFDVIDGEAASPAPLPPVAEDVPEAPDAPETPVEAADGAKLEIGKVSFAQANSQTWYSVSYAEEIPDAVVVMGPASHFGGHEGAMRIRNVTDQGFEYQFDEWDYLDGRHMKETVSWIAVSAGTHELEGGQTVSAGRASAQDETSETVALSGFDSGPMVFTQVSSDNGASAVTSRVTGTSSDSFDFLMQEEEANDGEHAEETVDWIALETGTGGPLDLTLMTGVDQGFASSGIDGSDGDLGLIAAMQTFNGSDTAAVRYRLDGSGTIQLQVEEERSRDSETGHADEDIAILTAETGLYELA